MRAIRLSIVVLQAALVACIAGCSANEPAPEPFGFDTPRPLVASDTESGEIFIYPLLAADSAAAIPDARMIASNGYIYQLEVADLDTAYAVRPAVPRSGPAFLAVTHGDSTTYAEFSVVPAEPSDLVVEVERSKPYDGSFTVQASVQDRYGNNLLPEQQSIVMTTTIGALESVVEDSIGRTTAVIRSSSPGKAILSVTETNSGYSSRHELFFPEIAMSGPEVLVLGEERPQVFPVDLYLHLQRGEKLRAYSITLSLNDLTAFASVDTTRGEGQPPLPDATVERGKVTLKAGPFPELYQPSDRPIPIGTVWFECRGEGESVVMVTDADYTVSSSPERNRRGNGQLWQRQGCVNKRRGKKLCINPIVLGTSWSNAEIITELRLVQDNLDEACCAITLEINGVSLERITGQNLNPPRINNVRSREGYPDDPGPVLDGRQNLHPETENFLRQHAAVRKADCLNIYFARYLGAFVSKVTDRWGNVLRTRFIHGWSRGTAVTGKRLGTDGRTVEDIPMRDSQGRQIGNGSPLSFDDVRSVFVRHDGIGQYTVKHEVGHVFGLRHPADYDRNARIRRGGNRAMGQDPNRGHKYTPDECRAIMSDMSGLLKN